MWWGRPTLSMTSGFFPCMMSAVLAHFKKLHARLAFSDQGRSFLPRREKTSTSQSSALMKTIPNRPPWAILVFLLSLGPGCESQTASPQGEPFIAWQTASGRAMEAIENARYHDVNALIVEFEPSEEQPGRVWSTFIDDLAFNDHTPRVAKRGQSRANVEKLRSSISTITSQGSSAGLRVYLVATEFSFPENLIAVYPEARDPDSPFLWAFLERRLEEVLLALPQAAGVLLYTDEPSDLIPYHFESSRREATLSRLLQVYLDVCTRLERRFIVCTMVNFESRKLDLLLSVLKRIPPSEHLLISNYVCPGDWGLIALHNPAIGRVGGHPEFLTFDYSGELWGQGSIPLIQAGLITDRVQKARKKGANLRNPTGWSPVPGFLGDIRPGFGEPEPPRLCRSLRSRGTADQWRQELVEWLDAPDLPGNPSSQRGHAGAEPVPRTAA